MQARLFTGPVLIATIALSAACSSAPRKSPVKEVQVEGSLTVAQPYAIEEPNIGDAEALTAEPVIQGSSLGSAADVLLGDIANGGQVYLSQFPQKVVLVNYWSSACDSCGQRLREMAQVSIDYQPFELIVANVNLGETPQAARTYLDAEGLGDFSGLRLTDTSGLAAAGVGVAGVPTTLLFDKNGMEVMRYGDNSNIDRIRQDLDLLLK